MLRISPHRLKRGLCLTFFVKMIPRVKIPLHKYRKMTLGFLASVKKLFFQPLETNKWKINQPQQEETHRKALSSSYVEDFRVKFNLKDDCSCHAAQGLNMQCKNFPSKPSFPLVPRKIPRWENIFHVPSTFPCCVVDFIFVRIFVLLLKDNKTRSFSFSPQKKS